jgi:uncharacterized membrane protein
MKYLRALLSTATTVILSLLVPVFSQWYEQTTGIEPKGFEFLSFFLGAAGILLTAAFWISAITDKEIKNFFDV